VIDCLLKSRQRPTQSEASIARRLRRTRAQLQADGLGFENVVKENVFTTDLDAFIRNKHIRKAYCGQHLPAASWVEVRRLYIPAFVVEIELTVVK